MTTQIVSRKTQTDFGYIVLIVVGFLVGNSPAITPNVYRIRRLLLIWSIFCVCWITAYSSGLISMITRPIHIVTVIKKKIQAIIYILIKLLFYAG